MRDTSNVESAEQEEMKIESIEQKDMKIHKKKKENSFSRDFNLMKCLTTWEALTSAG